MGMDIRPKVWTAMLRYRHTVADTVQRVLPLGRLTDKREVDRQIL